MIIRLIQYLPLATVVRTKSSYSVFFNQRFKSPFNAAFMNVEFNS